jgi:hypothetical protein
MRKKVLIVMAVLGFVSFTSIEAKAQSDQDVRHLLKRLEDNSDRFRSSLDHALDHSSLNGSRTEDEINSYVHSFEKATDRLKHDYEKHGSDPDNAREVLLRGRYIECFMRQHDLGIRAKGDWHVVRNDLDAWERFYGFSGAGALHNQYPANRVAWRSNLPCDSSSTHLSSNTSASRVHKTTRRVQSTRVRTSKPSCNCPSSSGKGH